MKTRHGITLILWLAAAFLAAPAIAQTTNGPVDNPTNTVATGTTTLPAFLGLAWETMVGQGLTNLSETTYMTYTPSIRRWGLGEVITRNIPIGGGVNTGLGIGVDYYDSQLYALNGQVSLSADLTPISSWGTWGKTVVITPFTFVGLGTPFGGSQASGNLETVIAAGAALHLAHVFGADFSLVGVYGHRTGLEKASGAFYGGGPTLTWKF